MARKSNLFKMNNTVINIVVLVIVLVLLYLFLGKCRENFTGTTVDYIKPSYFKPRGSNSANTHLLVMYYAPWCYYSKVALTGSESFGRVTGKTNYNDVQTDLGFDTNREQLGIEHKGTNNKTVTMAVINCDESGNVNDAICSGAGITAYPTIKVYELNSQTNVVTEKEYTGDNTISSINTYIDSL